MFGFTRYEENQIIPNSDMIREELLWHMTHDEKFINSISGSGTDNREKTTTRFQKWISTLEEIIGVHVPEPRTFSLHYKKQLYETNSICAICGQKIHLFDDAEVDHIEQYWRGGKTIPSNARLTHRYCNRARRPDEKGGENIIDPTPIKGKKISIKELIDDIVKILQKHGGRADKKQVDKEIYQSRKDIFEEEWYMMNDSYGPRWKHKIATAKEVAINNGLIKRPADSGRGIWELTENGKKYKMIKEND